MTRLEPIDAGPLSQLWECPLCHLHGQTWAGNVRGTNLFAHLITVHPEASRHPTWGRR